MKRKYFFPLVGLLLALCVNAQQSTSDVLKKMDQFDDQFNRSFAADKVQDDLVIVYVPGNDNPFGKVYDKHKGKGIKKNVQFIGGFAEMMNAMSKESKKSHLQDAFQARYGKDHFTILLDLDSEVQKMLGNKGYAIAKLSKRGGAAEIEDFGGDRAAFFQALKKYMK